MDYLGKGEMITKRDVNTFVHKLREVRSEIFYFSSENMEPTHLHAALIFFFQNRTLCGKSSRWNRKGL
jgi:hypothetical protein